MDNTFTGVSASAPLRVRERLTVIVTGRAGVLGSHLCERLVSKGHHAICIDNFRTGRPANVRGLIASSRFGLIEHDMVEPFECKLPRFDHLYNLAGAPPKIGRVSGARPVPAEAVL